MQHQGSAEDLTVGIEIEGLRLQHIRHPADGIRVQQDATQHRFLRLQILGRNGIGQGFKAWFLVAAAAAEPSASPVGVLAAIAHGGRSPWPLAVAIGSLTLAQMSRFARDQ